MQRNLIKNMKYLNVTICISYKNYLLQEMANLNGKKSNLT